MLVEQAAECFELWFDKKPAVEDVKYKLNERL
jgi:shikimate 5-dehydrogenase